MIRVKIRIEDESTEMAFALQEPSPALSFTIRSPAPPISYDVRDIIEIQRGEYPKYDDATTVIPKAWEDQVLPTKDTTVFEDITVKEIPISRVGNPYGDTITIG